MTVIEKLKEEKAKLDALEEAVIDKDLALRTATDEYKEALRVYGMQVSRISILIDQLS